MGLFNLFGGSRTKADIDREIAYLQGKLELQKAHLADTKARNAEYKRRKLAQHVDINSIMVNTANIKAKIASLKAERKNAPK